MIRLRPILTASILLAGAAASPAAVDFDFSFSSNPGDGFSDPVHGLARQAALHQAASIVESLFTGYTAIIKVSVDGAEQNNSTLAAAGSEFNGPNPASGFNDIGDVMKKILGQPDPAPDLPDATVTWNFQDFAWELGTDFQGNEFDFISTAAHELLHAVGFASHIQLNGSDLFGNAAGQVGIWAPFDRYVAGASGSIINSADFKLNLSRWSAARTAGAGAGLRFNGPKTLAANGGNPVFIYSPNPWEDGSSGSHLDDGLYQGQYIMEAATLPGLGIRTFSAIEIAMLQDIGYTLVPEPSSLFLLLGAGLTLGTRRRRR